MLIIRGNSRVADIYLGEFMRLYRHFAFRDWLTQHPDADEVQMGHLNETDQSWKRYFGDNFEPRQRSYFASYRIFPFARCQSLRQSVIHEFPKGDNEICVDTQPAFG